MNYGLYLSASGVLANSYRQDVFANNLANVNTPGFKPDIATVRGRDPEAIEEQFGGHLRKAVLDKLGGGVFAGPQHIQTAQASLEQTGGDLDVALDREGAYFAVQNVDPATGQQSVSLTRDGRFTRSADGHLVMMTNGMKLLGSNDQPLTVPFAADLKIGTDGRIFADGQEVGRLQVTGVRDTSQLVKQGSSLFRFERGSDLRAAAPQVNVKQGYVEQSGVNPITALMDVLNAGKAAESNAGMIRFFDEMMSRAVNQLGSVQ
jgi:flagellar basal body rod protein FlgG